MSTPTPEQQQRARIFGVLIALTFVREGDDNQLDRGASVLQAFSNVSDHARVAALTATHL